MEEQNLYREIPNLFVPHFDSIGAAEKNGVLPIKIGYMRCPSDDYESEKPYSNYVASLGPQCLDNFCNYEPYQQFCNMPAWGYTWSADDGTTSDPSLIRGMFARDGAPIRLADVRDGTSHTLLLGEALPSQNAH